MIRLRIRELAEERGFNIASLARRADLGFSTVRRLWRDPYQETTTTTLARISKALNVSSRELIEDVPDEEE